MEKCVNYIKPAMLVAVVSLTAGCTTVKGWFTEDDTTPTAERFNQTVKTPEGLTVLQKSEEFKLPEGTAKAEKSDHISSPYSVLEIFPGSWINNDKPHPYKIMLERPQEIEDFGAFINAGLNSFVESNGFEVLKKQSETKALIKATKTVETGMWFWEKDVPIESFTFTLEYSMQPHGRSGEVILEPVELKVLNQEYAGKVPFDLRKKQFAINMLNQFSVELDYQYRVVVKNNKANADVTLVMGKNSAKQDVITSQRDVGFVFKEMEDVLEDLGFEILEEDKTLFVYTLKYDKNGAGLWSQLFGSEHAYKVDLTSGTYDLIFVTSINGVHMLFTDEEGKAISKEQVQQIFDLIMKIADEEELEL